MKVEQFSQFGKALEMPKEGLKKQEKPIFSLLRYEFGLIGMLGLFMGIKKHTKRIKKEFPEQVEKAKRIGKDMDKQLCMMGALFFTIADKKDRKFAQDFMTGMMQKVAPVSMLNYLRP